MPKPAIQTQKELLLETIPKMQHEIRIEMISILKNIGYTEEVATEITDVSKILDPSEQIKPSEQTRKRMKRLIEFRTNLNTIEEKIKKDTPLYDKDNNLLDDEKLGEFYRNNLKNLIQEALLNPKLTKEYGCFKELAITLLNIITAITIVPAVMKKAVTGSFFHSLNQKSHAAIKKMDHLSYELNKKAAKITKQKADKVKEGKDKAKKLVGKLTPKTWLKF